MFMKSGFHFGEVHLSLAKWPHWKHIIFNICTSYLQFAVDPPAKYSNPGSGHLNNYWQIVSFLILLLRKVFGLI